MLQTKVNGKQLVYFDTAGTNHKPWIVIDKLQELYTAKYGKTQENHNFSQMMTKAFDETRSKVAKFIGAERPEAVVFTTGSTEAINIVANGFGGAILKEGDEVLISQLEHHSNIIRWQLACQVSGANLVVCPINSAGEACLGKFEQLLSLKTKIISITHFFKCFGYNVTCKNGDDGTPAKHPDTGRRSANRSGHTVKYARFRLRFLRFFGA